MGIYGDDSALLAHGYVLDPNYSYMGRTFPSYISQADYDKKYPKPAPPPPPPPAPAPVAAPPPAPPPAPVAPPLDTTQLGPPITAGGAIDQPPGGLGDQLGGAVLNPPKYFIGGVDSYDKAKPKTASSLQTTQS